MLEFDCEECGEPSGVEGAEEYGDKSLAWECPFCGAKNWTPGDPPHVVAVAQAAMGDDDVVSVTDGDAGTSLDNQG